MRIKILLTLIAVSQLTACTVRHTWSAHDAVLPLSRAWNMPVTENNATILKKLNIQTHYGSVNR